MLEHRSHLNLSLDGSTIFTINGANQTLDGYVGSDGYTGEGNVYSAPEFVGGARAFSILLGTSASTGSGTITLQCSNDLEQNKNAVPDNNLVNWQDLWTFDRTAGSGTGQWVHTISVSGATTIQILEINAVGWIRLLYTNNSGKVLFTYAVIEKQYVG